MADYVQAHRDVIDADMRELVSTLLAEIAEDATRPVTVRGMALVTYAIIVGKSADGFSLLRKSIVSEDPRMVLAAMNGMYQLVRVRGGIPELDEMRMTIEQLNGHSEWVVRESAATILKSLGECTDKNGEKKDN